MKDPKYSMYIITSQNKKPTAFTGTFTSRKLLGFKASRRGSLAKLGIKNDDSQGSHFKNWEPPKWQEMTWWWHDDANASAPCSSDVYRILTNKSEGWHLWTWLEKWVGHHHPTIGLRAISAMFRNNFELLFWGFQHKKNWTIAEHHRQQSVASPPRHRSSTELHLPTPWRNSGPGQEMNGLRPQEWRAMFKKLACWSTCMRPVHQVTEVWKAEFFWLTGRRARNEGTSDGDWMANWWD